MAHQTNLKLIALIYVWKNKMKLLSALGFNSYLKDGAGNKLQTNDKIKLVL